MARTALGVVLSLVGAVVGAAIGVAVFRWVMKQGLYAMVLPGAGLGLGVHLASLDRSQIRGVISGIAALAVGIAAEWHFFPFVADESFRYFITHILDVLPVHLLLIAIGGVFGYWWGKLQSPWAHQFGRKLIQVKRGVEG